MSRQAPGLLVLGLDGAALEVIEPLAAAGRLPALARWRRQGVARPLRSTLPAMSFSAWSTFLTGLEPGHHGLFDFTQKLPGAYRIRFTNARDRAGASLFARAARLGRGARATLEERHAWPELARAARRRPTWDPPTRRLLT